MTGYDGGHGSRRWSCSRFRRRRRAGKKGPRECRWLELLMKAWRRALVLGCTDDRRAAAQVASDVWGIARKLALSLMAVGSMRSLSTPLDPSAGASHAQHQNAGWNEHLLQGLGLGSARRV